MKQAAYMEEMSDQVRREVAPTGNIRVGIKFGNGMLAQRGPAGEPRGVSVELALGVASAAGVPAEFIAFDGAGDVFEAARTGHLDMAFLAPDPARVGALDFTGPYLINEGTYLVAESSADTSVTQVDREGVRIVSTRGTAYEMYLRRTLRHAALEPASSPAESFRRFRFGRFDALAGVRPALIEYASQTPGLRVLEGAFARFGQAIAIPKGRDQALSWLAAYVDHMKVSGFIADALRRSGHDNAVIPE